MNALRTIGTILYMGVAVLAALPLTAQEVDVAGINETYKDPNLDVDVWVERFETEGREAFDFRHEIVAALALEPGQAVADVGAGTGLFEPLLAARVGPEGKVYAVDIVPAFVDHIREQAAERGLSQIEAILGDERSAQLPAQSVDMVFVCDAYHHFEDYEAMLTSIHAALKPGGRLVIVDFERVDGESEPFVLDHIRASKEQFTAEIEASGFRFTEEVDIEGMTDTFMRRFERM